MGVVALDTAGSVVAGVSTGGKSGARDGRLGSGAALGQYITLVREEGFVVEAAAVLGAEVVALDHTTNSGKGASWY